MNIIDILILSVLALGLLAGLRSGLIRQVLGLVGIIIAFVLSFQMMGTVGESLSGLGMAESIASIVAFGLIFLIVKIGFLFLGRVLGQIVNFLQLSLINRILGGVVGGMKALLGLSILFLVLGNVNLPSEEKQNESVFYDEVYEILPLTWDGVTSIFPQVADLAERFKQEATHIIPGEEENVPIDIEENVRDTGDILPDTDEELLP